MSTFSPIIFLKNNILLNFHNKGWIFSLQCTISISGNYSIFLETKQNVIFTYKNGEEYQIGWKIPSVGQNTLF